MPTAPSVVHVKSLSITTLVSLRFRTISENIALPVATGSARPARRFVCLNEITVFFSTCSVHSLPDCISYTGPSTIGSCVNICKSPVLLSFCRTMLHLLACTNLCGIDWYKL
uniref:ORF75 n=1 Tax=Malaco herpesvirus 4 TaxID=3031800 RepID=A0AA48SIN5_9VIRU|nr:TPA_asm: ORF75 [Malaco herpesvirus 4]